MTEKSSVGGLNQELNRMQSLEEKRVDIEWVGDTNCMASVMSMAVNSLSRVAQRTPFTAHEVSLYLDTKRITAIPRALKRLASEQNVRDVTVEKKYLLEEDPPLEDYICQVLDQGGLVQIFVNANT